MISDLEAQDTFGCFGSSCSVLVLGDSETRSAHEAVALARSALLGWHRQFSRFLPDSELSRVNADAREEVPVSPMMALLADAVRDAGAITGGLVDATLLRRLESAGYSSDLDEGPALAAALKLAPPRRPAAPARSARWRRISLNAERSALVRPPGVMLDSGGLAKGLFADVLAAKLSSHAGFAVNCAGDLALGGNGRVLRAVNVASPFDGETLHTFELASGGVATSGIGRRSWLDADGHPAHHLLDPSTGRPAFTGIVQATALAPTALLAEIRAKAALLAGPRGARAWLGDGGAIVLDDGSVRVFEPPPRVTVSRLGARVRFAPGTVGAAPFAAAGRPRAA